MAEKITFKIKGAKEMESLLKQLGPRLASRAGDRALKAGAKPIVDEAKRLVPVDSGRLRKSITAVTDYRGRASSQRLVKIGFRPPRSRIAHFVEFGTSRMSAQPFMRPAMDTKAAAALTEMGKELALGIEREAAALRKRK